MTQNLFSKKLCIIFLIVAFSLSTLGAAEKASAKSVYKKAEAYFKDKDWAKAKETYMVLVKEYRSDPFINPKMISIQDRIMRCDFYKDVFDFEKVFKKELDIWKLKITTGKTDLIEVEFDFDSKKQIDHFPGLKFANGAAQVTEEWVSCGLKFQDPCQIEVQLRDFPLDGMFVGLFVGENYKGQDKGYYAYFDPCYGGVLFKDGKKKIGKEGYLDIGYDDEQEEYIIVRGKQRNEVVRIGERSRGRSGYSGTKPEKRNMGDTKKVIIQKIRGRIMITAGKFKLTASDRAYSKGHVFLGFLGSMDSPFSEKIYIDSIKIKSSYDKDWMNSLRGEFEGAPWIEFKNSYEDKYGKIIPGDKTGEGGNIEKGRLKITLTDIAAEFIRDKDVPWDARRVLAVPYEMIEKQKYNQAETHLAGIISQNPDDWPGYLLRAVSRIENSNSEGARKDLTELDRVKPGLYITSFLRGILLFRSRNFEQAGSLFAEAFSRRPTFIVAGLYEIFAKYFSDDIAGAEEKMRELAGKFPDNEMMQGGNRMFYLLKNGPEWTDKFVSRGTKYTVYSEVSEKNARRMRQAIEAVYNEYKKFFPLTLTGRTRYNVFIFKSFGSFADYAIDSGEMPPAPQIQGLYNPILDHLLIRGDNSEYEIISTVFHEGLHQYLEYYIKDAPIWFNEGLATFFEASYFENGKFHAGILNRNRLGVLHAAFDGRISGARLQKFEKLMLSDASDFMEGLGNQVVVNYAQSWSIVYYMIMHKEMMHKYLKPYFVALKKGKSKEDAFNEVMKNDVAEIEQKWREYFDRKQYLKHIK